VVFIMASVRVYRSVDHYLLVVAMALQYGCFVRYTVVKQRNNSGCTGIGSGPVVTPGTAEMETIVQKELFIRLFVLIL
jgi:hypothetical protein